MAVRDIQIIHDWVWFVDQVNARGPSKRVGLEAVDLLEAQRYQALVRSMLDAEVFEAVWIDGQALSFEQQLWELLTAR